MNMHTDLQFQIDQAELAGDVYALASILRQMLIERAGFTATKPKPAKPRAAAGDDRYLTNTERRAKGLPEYKDGKFGGGTYRWVLIEFANGMRVLNGCYPRAKNPDDLSPAIIGARARYLLTMGGGRLIDPKAAKRVPRVTSARELTDAAEITRERLACLRMGNALETFIEQERREREMAKWARLGPAIQARRQREMAKRYPKMSQALEGVS